MEDLRRRRARGVWFGFGVPPPETDIGLGDGGDIEVVAVNVKIGSGSVTKGPSGIVKVGAVVSCSDLFELFRFFSLSKQEK